MHLDLCSSDPDFQRFSKTQRAALIGFCGVRKWKEVPKIWKTIEGTKTEEDLRTELARSWKTYQTMPNVLFFDISWPEDMIKCIRKASFVKSYPALFLTSEAGISMLNLLPHSCTEMERIRQDRETRKTCQLPTYTEANKMQKMPRLPPTTWSETVQLLTTYSLFLEMLFGRRNLHLQGVNEVKDQLMTMSGLTDILDPEYFAQVCWYVIDDMCRHFGEPLVMSDFVGRDNLAIMYPRSNLTRLALVLSMHQPLKHVAFPQEWRDSLAFGSAPAQPHLRHKPQPEYGPGKDTPTRDRSKGLGRPGADPKKALTHGMEGGENCKAKHPDRYGKDAKNPSVPPSIKALLQPLLVDGKVHMRNLYRHAKTGYMKCSYASNGKRVCPNWVCGQCQWEDCVSPHVLTNELPRDYPVWLEKMIQPGVDPMKKAMVRE